MSNRADEKINVHSKTITIKNDNNIRKKFFKIKSFNKLNSKFNNSTLINSSKCESLYPYPICLYEKKDPIEDYRFRIIFSRDKNDIFSQNYLKFNFSKYHTLNKSDFSNKSI